MVIDYLLETESIDNRNPIILAKVSELKRGSDSQIEYVERAFRFVRDEIPHSWDIKSHIVFPQGKRSISQQNWHLLDKILPPSFVAKSEWSAVRPILSISHAG